MATLTSIKNSYNQEGIDSNKEDIALLAFKTQANGSLAKYSLVDQTVDAFESAAGVDAAESTAEIYDSSGKYYSGGSGGGVSFTREYTTVGTISWQADTNVVEVLVIGGGGAGNPTGGAGGGGGGGGAAYHASKSITNGQNYTITVGAGGSGTRPEYSPGVADNAGVGGDDSVFGDITGMGGGGGGAGNNTPANGLDGGSGGGGQIDNGGPNGNSGGVTNQTTGAPNGGATGYGSNGGDGYTGSGTNDQGGGGGGATAAGANGASGDPGDGGTGKEFSIRTGSNEWYASGGGGGTRSAGTGANGGAGGATGGGTSTDGADGAANRGMGGGAGGSGTTGGDGGSGIVVTKGTTVAQYNNMTLASTATVAQTAPTKGDLVFTYTNGAGTAVVGTNITAEYSANDGGAWTDFLLAAGDVQGTTGGHTIVAKHDVALTSTSGTNMKWRIKTLVQSASLSTRIHAVSLGWS